MKSGISLTAPTPVPVSYTHLDVYKRQELGASALAGIYYLATYMLGFGFSIGLQVMIARRNGEQRCV